MTEGYASDINGDDTVMDSPEATISIDLTAVPPSVAFQLVQAAGKDQQEEHVVGMFARGEHPEAGYVNDAEFHIPVEAAITALEELNITTQPDEADTDQNA